MLAGLLITIAFGRAFAEAEGKDPLTQDGPAEDWAIKKPEKNLVPNSGFEEVDGLAPVGWRLEKGNWGANNRTDQSTTEPSGPSTQAPDAYGSGIHCLARKHEGKRYLIAVNAQPRSVECEFVVPGLRADVLVKVLFEEREIPMAGDRFADRFHPYQRHVYRWGRR